MVTANATGMSGYMVSFISCILYKSRFDVLHELTCLLTFIFLLQVYSMDICPNYAAIIYGFASGLGNSAGFFLSLLMDYVIDGAVSCYRIE